MSIDNRSERLAGRIAWLCEHDRQFAATRPDAEVSSAASRPGAGLAEIIEIVTRGYAQRPALGQRAVQYVTESQTGRTSALLLPWFDTITYAQLRDRLARTAAAWQADGVRAGDRVAILGFTSVDYTTIDLALALLGAVSVPLQTSTSPAQLTPIIAETEPVVIAAGVDFLAEAVELAAAAASVRRVVVFDYRPQVDDHRDALAAAQTRLRGVATVEPLGDVLDRGATLPAPPAPATEGDPLALLIYTSGSTGAPKGAMYPQSNVANMWLTGERAAWHSNATAVPSIALSFMPMSHVMGRVGLYNALGAGGTVNFSARSDLSTFLEDLALTRPTQLNFVPRIWDMLHQEFQREVDRSSGPDRAAVEEQVLAQLRRDLLGGRFVTAFTGSAPISPEIRVWVERLLDFHLLEGYGSTEAGVVFIDGQVRRPPVIDYKLADVPELGYFGTDRPHPRGELLVKSTHMFPGYYRRPETTREMFDADGFYRTGDIVAETAPEHLEYVDRRNNVLKLSQGEFVTISKLEAVYAGSPLVRQIYLYGNSARSYLLAVIVPTEAAVANHPAAELKSAILASLQESAALAGLQSYEVPRDFLLESEPFTLHNGLLTGIRKLARPQLKQRYGELLEQLYATLAAEQADELAALRRGGADLPVAEVVSRAAAAVLGTSPAELRPDAHFTDLGGDSLSALTFANLLHEILGVDVPVGVIVSPVNDLASIAGYIDSARSGASARATFASVHGRDAVVARAADLTLDKFIDAETLRTATALPGPATEVRTVLLTGATGFLGRYLALEWLRRMELVDGKVICLVRARDDAGARARLDATFGVGDPAGDPELAQTYQRLAEGHLEVLAGDKGERDLGLDGATWQRLADTVDLIVDPAALVNHLLPYSQLFGPNVAGTAELIRLALTTRLKPFVYVSTIAVGAGVDHFTENADVRVMSPVRAVDDSYANGYGNSKWAGEVLLREAHELCGLAVSVFRCDMILADTTYTGQLNVPDMFTRLLLSLVATGLAPESFYALDEQGNRRRAHYDGLPVEFIAEAVSELGVRNTAGFETFHVMNPHDDGIGLDQFVDWLTEAGYPISRIPGYDEWFARFGSALRGLPENRRLHSLLPLLDSYQHPQLPVNGAMAPTERFRTAVQEAKIGPDKDIPHIGRNVIVKYATDLTQLGLL